MFLTTESKIGALSLISVTVTLNEQISASGGLPLSVACTVK